MSILIIWLFSLIPLFIAGGLWIYTHKFNWIEALILTGVGFLIAGSFHFFGIHGMTSDTEIWSGQVLNSKYIPSWIEYYEEAIYRTETYTDNEYYTDAKGHSKSRTVTKTRRVFSHWEPRTRLHPEEFNYTDNLGNTKNIDKSRHIDIKSKFGNKYITIKGDRTTCEHNSRLLQGDPNDYIVNNETNHVYPIHESRSWSNKIKACPSVFSFQEVPKNIKVHDYPLNKTPFTSNRVINAPIPTYQWDQLNAELGPWKKVNLIIIWFEGQDESIAEYQKAKWIGGKKNDLVICYGGSDSIKADWVKVFGWTEKEIVKVNLEQLLLNNKINLDILPKIKEIVANDYIIKDWSKFDYLTIELPTSLILWYILTQIIICTGFVIFSLKNPFDKSYNEKNLIKNDYKYS